MTSNVRHADVRYADARIVAAAFPNYFHAILGIKDPDVRSKEMRRAAEEARALGWRLCNGEPVPPGMSKQSSNI